MTFPFPTGTRQMVLQFLQVKYLWAVSAWRALAADRPFFTFQVHWRNLLFYSRRL